MDLPAEIEICARVLNGLPCKGVIYRPLPEQAYCYRCGGNAPGVIYVRKEAA